MKKTVGVDFSYYDIKQYLIVSVCVRFFAVKSRRLYACGCASNLDDRVYMDCMKRVCRENSKPQQPLKIAATNTCY